MAQRCDVHNIRIFWIDNDTADLARFFKPDMLPGPSCIGGFVNSAARAEGGANIRFACAYIDNVAIGRSNSNRTHRSDWRTVGDGVPRNASIRALEDAATHTAEVEGIRIARRAHGGHGTSAAKGTDEPPLQRRG